MMNEGNFRSPFPHLFGNPETSLFPVLQLSSGSFQELRVYGKEGPMAFESLQVPLSLWLACYLLKSIWVVAKGDERE